jgi:hypothetical protein
MEFWEQHGARAKNECAALEANGENRGGRVSRVNTRWYGGGKLAVYQYRSGHTYRWSEYWLRVGAAKLRVAANQILGFWYSITRTFKTWVQWSDRPDQGRQTVWKGADDGGRTRVPWAWAIRHTHGRDRGNVYALYAFFFFF